METSKETTARAQTWDDSCLDKTVLVEMEEVDRFEICFGGKRDGINR